MTTPQETFASSKTRFVKLASSFVDDPAPLVDRAEARFESMIPTMGYRDNPDHPMAGDVLACDALLALFLELRDRGVDAHRFGRAVIQSYEELVGIRPPDDTPMSPEALDAWTRSAAASQADQRPGEFIYEHVPPSEGVDSGLNVTSCAICASYSRYDAMDLVPYMCAVDDVISTHLQQGLRRTGTIALGADRCDFRYQSGGTPLPVADQYPDRIRLHP